MIAANRVVGKMSTPVPLQTLDFGVYGLQLSMKVFFFSKMG
jgi:hypothetical protein